MERSELLGQITTIFKEVLDNEEVELTDATQATDVDEWDSLTHIQLVVALEKTFNIRFTSREIQSWTNIGELMDCIAGKA